MQARATTLLQQWLRERGDVPDAFRDRIPQQRVAIASASRGVGLMQQRYADGLRALGLDLGPRARDGLRQHREPPARAGQSRSARRPCGARCVAVTSGAPDGDRRVVLSIAGGLAGVRVAYLLTRVILALAFRGCAGVPVEPHPSLPVLAFAVVLSLLTGVMFSAGPAWITSRANPIEALRGAGARQRGVPRRRGSCSWCCRQRYRWCCWCRQGW